MFALLTCQHVDVGSVRDGKDVGWNFIPPLASVQLCAPHRVHGESLVRVDSHAEQARVCLSERGGRKNKKKNEY